MKTYTQYSFWNVPVEGGEPDLKDSWIFDEPFYVLDLGLDRKYAEKMVESLMGDRGACDVGQHKIIKATIAIRSRQVTHGDWE